MLYIKFLSLKALNACIVMFLMLINIQLKKTLPGDIVPWGYNLVPQGAILLGVPNHHDTGSVFAQNSAE